MDPPGKDFRIWKTFITPGSRTEGMVIARIALATNYGTTTPR